MTHKDGGERKPYSARMALFVKERFHPVSHVPMIALFFVCVWMIAGISGSVRPVSVPAVAALAIGTVAFFFKLRLYDEIKDYAVDVRLKPHRALARGLVTKKELLVLIAVCIAVEIAAFSAVSIPGGVAMALAVGYSLLMYREFFIGKFLRLHLTTYAVTHTVVCSILTLALFAALHNRTVWNESAGTFLFALANWCLFNVFEFGRKTFAPPEEHPEADSYSKVFGPWGAVLLNAIMAAAASGLILSLKGMPQPATSIFVWICCGGLALAGTVYALDGRPHSARLYRAVSSIYIIVVFAGLSFLLALKEKLCW